MEGKEKMTDIVLIYPYIDPPKNRSIFRFPPLGIGYIASYLRKHQISVEIVDCTFLSEEEALRRVRASNPSIIGIYSMFTMKERSIRFAKSLRNDCELLIAGGPLPTVYPEIFLKDFNVVVIGEGEQTTLEIVETFKHGGNLRGIHGIAYRKNGKIAKGSDCCDEIQVVHSPPRKPISDLNSLPFPSRGLFNNKAYINYYQRTHGYTTTSIITSRGCPFDCDFCSKPVFGDFYRERSAKNVVDEIEEILEFGYEQVFFVDDCFTLSKKRVTKICDEIKQRRINFAWECLSRVDSIDITVASSMKEAGCKRIFFGIESGNNLVLKSMNKGTTVEQARKAVERAASMEIKTGAFFILGYPGESDKTILDTIRFATKLPLDYLSFTFPYPIPGTGLHKKVKDYLKKSDFEPSNKGLIDQEMLFEMSFSERKLKFAIAKAMIQFHLNKRFGKYFYSVLGKPLEIITDRLFTLLR